MKVRNSCFHPCCWCADDSILTKQGCGNGCSEAGIFVRWIQILNMGPRFDSTFWPGSSWFCLCVQYGFLAPGFFLHFQILVGHGSHTHASQTCHHVSTIYKAPSAPVDSPGRSLICLPVYHHNFYPAKPHLQRWEHRKPTNLASDTAEGYV